MKQTEALDIMCKRCCIYSDCNGTGCQPKKTLEEVIISENTSYMAGYEKGLDEGWNEGWDDATEAHIAKLNSLIRKEEYEESPCL